ncbi:hypothetical protein V6N12_070360 [Hibiscus sabdariffa]|uniref:RNase H type-1 domain-containing protein n=1 Tax=Hibiscus sabdariffa TaxID=183260 RepID=A0ABR2FH68_9ROSI
MVLERWWCCFNFNIVILGDFKSLVKVWASQPVHHGKFPIWSIVLFSFIWTIWLHRNERVFDKKLLSVSQLYELAILRTGHWAKCNWPQSIPSLQEFTHYPQEIFIIAENNQRQAFSCWVAPQQGFLKFSVDVAVKGSFDKAGIGGILRDERGNCFARFSKAIGFSYPSQAELKSVLETCEIFLASEWVRSHKLIIESDSQLSVNWILNPRLAPNHFALIVGRCHNIINGQGWQIQFAFRDVNGEAHLLAKQGIDRSSELFEIMSLFKS